MSLEQVANKAKVSTATVSRVVNGIGAVRNSTRLRVERALSELRYHPNLHARSLAGACSRTIGLIVPNLDNPFFLDLFRSVESECHAHGYEALLASSAHRSTQLMANVRLMTGRRVAGLAVVASEMEKGLVHELTNSEMPVVFFGFGQADGSIAKIAVDYRRGVERAVEYLATLGHKQFAFIGHHEAPGTIDDRRRTLFDTLGRLCPGAAVLIAAEKDSLEGGRQAVRDLLASGPVPTAIVCVNDFMALGVLKELRDRGIRVPQDMSVTGFDNIQLSEICYPALTTVHIPSDRIGRTLFASLTQGTGALNTTGKEFVIDSEFLVRDSTGPARVWEI